MADHVAAVCRSCYYQLRQLRSVARSLSAEAVKAVVHAFISSRLDYCNSLLTGVNDGLLRRLQSVQNAAARLVTGTRRCDHITPALRLAAAALAIRAATNPVQAGESRLSCTVGLSNNNKKAQLRDKPARRLKSGSCHSRASKVTRSY